MLRLGPYLPSFIDELEKTSGLERLGRRALGTVQRGVKGGVENVKKTLTAFKTPGRSLSEGWTATMRPGGKPLSTPWKVFMGGSLALGVHGAAKKEDPTGRGRSRLRRVTGLVGDQAGGLIGAPFGLAGGLTGSYIGGKLGDVAGAGIDRVRGVRPRPQVQSAAASPPTLPPRPQGLNG